MGNICYDSDPKHVSDGDTTGPPPSSPLTVPTPATQTKDEQAMVRSLAEELSDPMYMPSPEPGADPHTPSQQSAETAAQENAGLAAASEANSTTKPVVPSNKVNADMDKFNADMALAQQLQRMDKFTADHSPQASPRGGK